MVTLVRRGLCIIELLREGIQQQQGSRRHRKKLHMSCAATAEELQITKEEGKRRLIGRRVAFSTPALYASRLQELLHREGASTIWCPSVMVESTPQTRQAGIDCLSSTSFPLGSYSGIAFTSRAGINALEEVLRDHPHLGNHLGDEFFVAALGRDAELLQELDLLGVRTQRVKMMVPSVATPQALVEELGEGHGKHILCPVPFVDGLQEPRIIPDFLHCLNGKGWKAKRLNAYVTRWAGPDCAKPLLSFLQGRATSAEMECSSSSSLPMSCSSQLPSASLENLDALVFTSTAEVEGLLKSLKAFGITSLQGGNPIITAHGPVTAAGAAHLGVDVDVISRNFHSFDGIVDALVSYWASEVQ